MKKLAAASAVFLLAAQRGGRLTAAGPEHLAGGIRVAKEEEAGLNRGGVEHRQNQGQPGEARLVLELLQKGRCPVEVLEDNPECDIFSLSHLAFTHRGARP
jgi:hypothetical protein